MTPDVVTPTDHRTITVILRLRYYESQKLKECFPLLLKPLSSNQAVRDLELC